LNLDGSGDVGTASQRLNTTLGTIAFNKGGGKSYVAASPIASPGTVNVHGSIAGGGWLDLKADSLTIDMPLTAPTTILQPLTAKTIDLGGTDKSGATLSLTAAELNNITAGVLLRFGDESTYAGNIIISQPITLGAQTPILSLKTATGGSGTVSEIGAGMLTVANLSLEAPAVSLGLNCNDVQVLASLTTKPIEFQVKAKPALADGQMGHPNTLDGVAGLSPPSTLITTCSGASINFLGQTLASISYVDIPVPRLSLTELDSSADFDASKAQEQYGPGAIATYYSQVPREKRFRVSKLKLEEQSKWVSGHLAISGSTTGPQASQ
jgi:hypothetical protein